MTPRSESCAIAPEAISAQAPEPTAGPACIGVFDSGVGGLTILREIQRVLPGVPLHYVADTAHAPYGQRPADFIIQRSTRLTEYLLSQGARVLVVACNTATAHAITALRARWPELPIVGTEPGIKPAVAASRTGRIGVMATPATMASARYQTLVQRHAGAAQICSLPCPGLVELIETGDFDSPALRALLRQLCRPLHEAEVDTVLMGCTHYPLIQAQLQAELGPDVLLLNIETAVAQQAARLWAALPQPAHSDPVSSNKRAPQAWPRLHTTGEPLALSRFVQQVMGWPGAQAEWLDV